MDVHASGEKHLRKAPSKKLEFYLVLLKANEPKADKNAATITSPKQQCSMQGYLELEIERMFCLDVIVSKCSLNSCSNKNDLCVLKIAKLSSCFHVDMKTMYIIKFGLSPYFRSMLLETHKESPC